MKPKNLGILKGSLLFTAFAVSFVCAVVVVSNLHDAVVEHQIINAKREMVLVTGDGDPGAGKSGFFYAMIYPNSGDPGTDYAVNLSNATAYEYSDIGNESATGETSYFTAFDIVIKVGINESDGYNLSSSAWEDGYTWLTLTCADLGIGADTNMTELEIAYTGSTYRWMHYYLNNGGAGYQIDVGEHFNITSMKFYVQRLIP